jgi:hypothetical protein
MSNGTFVLVLTGGAGLLAMWIHARFPKLAPERMRPALMHAVAAFALLQLTTTVGFAPAAVFATVFLLVLPAFVYALLCTIWILVHAQAALGSTR